MRATRPATIHKRDAVFRFLATLWVFSTVIVVSKFKTGTLGYSAYSGNGKEYVAAGSTPIALGLALIGLVLFFVVVRTELRIANFRSAPVWRRYTALVVDFWSFLFISATLTAMISLLLEASYTGKFRWTFERDYFISSDWTGTFLVIGGLGAMVAYFVLPLASRRQTLGRRLLRIATVNDDGSPVRTPVFVAALRTYREVRELFSPSMIWRRLKGNQTDEDGSYERGYRFMVVHY